LVCFLPSYLAFISHSLFFCFTFLTKKKKLFFFFTYAEKRADPQVLVAHIQRARNSTSHSLLMSKSTPPPPRGFAPSTAAENEASVSPPPGFTPSTAPADEVRVSPPLGFAPSTETVADEVRVPTPPPPVLLIKKDFRRALYYLQHGVCHSEP
jgi:hypothetical protein